MQSNIMIDILSLQCFLPHNLPCELFETTYTFPGDVSQIEYRFEIKGRYNDSNPL